MERRTDTSELAPPTVAGATFVRLWIEEPGRAPRPVVVPAGTSVRIGRAEVAEVPIADSRVSRIHAVLSFDGRTVTVRDEKSSNGTFVNGVSISGTVEISPGTAVQVGGSLLVLSAAPEGGARRSRPPRSERPAEDDAPVAVSSVMVSLLAQAQRYAETGVPLLIRGEPGTGKSLLAREVHRRSPRAARPIVRVPCALLPENASRALLGRERSTPGGVVCRRGLIERADTGTLVLDDVDALSAADQALLLRALERREVTPIGGRVPRAVDVRVVATTSRDLLADVVDGRFDVMLLDALSGATLALPPLRARSLDVIPLVENLLATDARGWRLGRGVAALLRAYPWPGNVTELRAAVAFALTLAEGDEVGLDDLPRSVAGDDPEGAPVDAMLLRSQLEEFERRSVELAMRAASGNRSRAARLLGMSRQSLVYKIERLGLRESAHR